MESSSGPALLPHHALVFVLGSLSCGSDWYRATIKQGACDLVSNHLSSHVSWGGEQEEAHGLSSVTDKVRKCLPVVWLHLVLALW